MHARRQAQAALAPMQASEQRSAPPGHERPNGDQWQVAQSHGGAGRPELLSAPGGAL